MACDINSIDEWRHQIKNIKGEIRKLADHIEKKTGGRYHREIAYEDIKNDIVRLRREGEKTVDVLKDKSRVTKLKKSLAERIEDFDEMKMESVKRKLSTQSFNILKELYGEANDFRRRFETHFLSYRKTKNKMKLEYIKEVNDLIEKVTGTKMTVPEFINKASYEGWEKDYNALLTETFLKENITPEMQKSFKDKPLLEVLHYYLGKEKEHLREIFPSTSNKVLLEKIKSKNLDNSKLYNMDEVGGKINNVLFGNSRVILSNSEYESAFENFFSKYRKNMASLKGNKTEMRKLFDILNGKIKSKEGTGISNKILSSNFASRDLLSTIEENFLIDIDGQLKRELEQLITNDFVKNPLEMMDDGLENIARETQLIKQFGKDPNKTFEELSDYLAKTSEHGGEKEMKLEHLQEARTFVQQVYQGKEQEYISDNTMINVANVVANKVAIPLALSGAALNHMFESVGYLTKDTLLTGKVDPQLLLKTFFGVFRDGSSLMVRIPMQTLYELPLGKTYKKVIKNVARTIDWSSLRKLDVEDQLELLSNIKLTTEEFAYNHSNGFDIGDDFLYGIPSSLAKISSVDVVDKFAINRSHQGSTKIVNRLMEHLLEGKKVNRAHKKLLKDSNTSKTDFEMYRLHLEREEMAKNRDMAGVADKNEEMRRIAMKDLIPEKPEDLTETQKKNFIHYKVVKALNEEIGTFKKKGEMGISFRSELSDIAKSTGLEDFLEIKDDQSLLDFIEISHSIKDGATKVSLKADVKMLEKNVSEIWMKQRESEIEAGIENFKEKNYKFFKEEFEKDKTINQQNIKDLQKYYEINRDEMEHDLDAAINRRVEGVEGLKQHLIRYYNSARTDAGFKRALSGLDSKYHTITDLLIKTKTLFTGVSTSAFEQGKMGMQFFNENIRDENGKVVKDKFAKNLASLAAVMTMVGIYTGVLYNLKKVAMGQKADWSPSGALAYGMRDDVLVGAAGTMVNNYDSYASKLMYGIIMDGGSPVLRAMKNNPLFYNYFLQNYVYGQN